MGTNKAFDYLKAESQIAWLQDLEIGVNYEGVKKNELLNLFAKYATFEFVCGFYGLDRFATKTYIFDFPDKGGKVIAVKTVIFDKFFSIIAANFVKPIKPIVLEYE